MNEPTKWVYEGHCLGDLPGDWQSMSAEKLQELWDRIVADTKLWDSADWSAPKERRCSASTCQGDDPQDRAQARIQPTQDAFKVHPGTIVDVGGTVIGRMELLSTHDDAAYAITERDVIGNFVVLLPSGAEKESTDYVIVQVKRTQNGGYSQKPLRKGVYGICVRNHTHGDAEAGYVDCKSQEDAVRLLSDRGNVWSSIDLSRAADSLQRAKFPPAAADGRCWSCDNPGWESCPFGCCSLRY